MSDKTEIKSCPACGGEARIWEHDGGDCASCYSVICDDCDSESRNTTFEHEAIEAWNNQPRIDELEAKVKALEEQSKAKTLVWDEDDDGHKSTIMKGAIDLNYVDNLLRVIDYNGHILYKETIASIDEAKQAAQEWYDNYVAEFIWENTE